MKNNSSKKSSIKGNNNKSGKRQSLTNKKKNPKEMKTLKNPNDVIELGIYAGETLRSFLKKYGIKAFPDVLKYYNLSEEIMREYHCHLRPHKEETPAVDSAQDSIKEYYNTEDNTVATNEDDQADVEVEGNDALNTTDLVELDDNKWTSSRSDYENSALYDPEDDIADTRYYDKLMRGRGMALSQEIANL